MSQRMRLVDKPCLAYSKVGDEMAEIASALEVATLAVIGLGEDRECKNAAWAIVDIMRGANKEARASYGKALVAGCGWPSPKSEVQS